MKNDLLPKFPAGTDLRGTYELELADCIECRRRIARECLEVSENAMRTAMEQATAKVQA